MNEEFYRRLVDAALDAIITIDESGRVTGFNRAAERLFGHPAQEAVGRDLADLIIPARFRDEHREGLRRFRETGEARILDRRLELAALRQDGTEFPVELTVVRVAGTDPPVFAGYVRDLSERAREVAERRELEQALHQARKMDAIGRLAGGVAHDFNNILTAIMGYAAMLKAALPEGDARQADAEEIHSAAQRAAELTQQLLAFGRKQLLAPRVLDLGQVVRDLEPMLRRLMGVDVSIQTRIAPDLGRVEADPSRIEQVVVNLVVNGRDAMPGGGTITIELVNGELAAGAGEGDVAAGPMVVLSVTDTGIGMDEETLSHIFEPFFTTKEPGSGTGLGLATVYGIVRQSGGYLEVTSTLGGGATFLVYLPRVEAAPAQVVPAGPKPGRGRPGETIMVVEDEPAVRALLERALTRAGFSVIAASDPKTAREKSASTAERIHLLLTDVVMPGGGGRALADALVAERPDLKVIYMSGYTDDVIARQRVRDPGVAFLQKPFSAEEAATRIREVLDGGPGLREGEAGPLT